MAAPNDKELSLLSQFRRNLADLCLSGENNSDTFLLKWLRAKELDLVQAEAMLRKSLAWRKENDMDNLLKWKPPAYLVEEYPYAILGHDKEGCPLITLPYGRHDIKKIVDAGQRDEYLKYIDRAYESLLEVMRKTSVNNGKQITQLVSIYDMQHLSFRLLTHVGAVETMLETVRRFEANYPETLKASYIINCSRVFTLLYNVMKPCLSKKTAERVRIFGSNQTKWKEALLKDIPADQLPVYFGGNSSLRLKWYESKKNGQPEGKTAPSDGEDYSTATVQACEKLNVGFYIEHPNTTVSWSFKTDYKDIGFSVLYENKEEIVPYEKVNAHVQKQNGELNCVKPGNYILCFDNTYSRLTSKILHYSITVNSSVEG